MGLPKGYKKTWNSGGGRPKGSTAAERRRNVPLYLNKEELSRLDAMRGAQTRSGFIRERLSLSKPERPS